MRYNHIKQIIFKKYGVFASGIELFIHVVFWLYLIIAAYFTFYIQEVDSIQKLEENVLNPLFFLSFFYLNTYYFIPIWIKERSWQFYWIRIFLIVFILTVLSFLLGKGYDFGGVNMVIKQKEETVFRIPSVLNIIVPAFIVSFLYRGMRDWFLMEKERKELKELSKQTEMQFLQNQLNPHFLFNSLNGLYGMSLRHQQEDMSTYIEDLSDLLRYVLKTSKEQTISLDVEVEFIKSYIQLEKARLSKQHDVKLILSNESLFKSLKLPPLLILPFVENAFKHGISSTKNSFVKVEINAGNERLKIKISNSKSEHVQQEMQIGVGIENTKRRLALLYPNCHTLLIREEANVFEVELSLKLK